MELYTPLSDKYSYYCLNSEYVFLFNSLMGLVVGKLLNQSSVYMVTTGLPHKAENLVMLYEFHVVFTVSSFVGNPVR